MLGMSSKFKLPLGQLSCDWLYVQRGLLWPRRQHVLPLRRRKVQDISGNWLMLELPFPIIVVVWQR